MSLMCDVALGLRGNVPVGVRPRVRLLRRERIFVGLRQLGVARTRICIYLPLCRQHCPDKLAHRRLRKAVGTALFRTFPPHISHAHLTTSRNYGRASPFSSVSTTTSTGMATVITTQAGLDMTVTTIINLTCF